jgi:replicative DNA helicase
MIAFVYGDEMYHKDSKVAGTAEVIIAKQRNGPTDTAILTYLNQYTRFENFVAGAGLALVATSRST